MNRAPFSQGFLMIVLILAIMLPGCTADSGTPAKGTLEPTKPTPATPEPTAPSPSTPDLQLQLAKSKVQRVLSPNAPTNDMQKLVEGNSAFALDLYQALQGEDENLFFSPYSISAALAMTYAGARENTAQQMADTLHFILSQEQLHPAFNALDLQLVSQNSGATTEDGKDFTLNITNSLWGQHDYAFLPEFLDLLAANYGAGLRLVDFVTAPDPSRIAINDWVSEQTEDKIKDLIPEGAITDLTRLVLANAIYFYADWLYPFNAKSTHDAAFHLPNGSEVTVPMMSMSDPANLPYASGTGYQAVELPYLGGKASMTIIVPDSGTFADFESALSADLISEIVSSLEQKSVDLRLPKFSYESSISLAQTLAEMGMPDAISPGVADFSGMDGTKFLYISDVFHKAFVAVDEKGTEAAAATAVVVGITSVPMVDVRLTIDRPFIFLIRDIDTGIILFMGRVLSPVG